MVVVSSASPGTRRISTRAAFRFVVNMNATASSTARRRSSIVSSGSCILVATLPVIVRSNARNSARGGTLTRTEWFGGSSTRLSLYYRRRLRSSPRHLGGPNGEGGRHGSDVRAGDFGCVDRPVGGG